MMQPEFQLLTQLHCKMTVEGGVEKLNDSFEYLHC